MELRISTNFPEVERALERLHGAIRHQVLATSINRTLEQAQTQMVREITREFNVKRDYVKQRLRIRRASARGFNFEGSLIGSNSQGRGRSANIIAFVVAGSSKAELARKAKGGKGNVLYVKVKRAGQRKPLPGAFIGNKGRTVFRRVGKERLPIKPVQVIDVGQMFNTKRINSVVVAKVKERFPVIFAREARYYTERFNRGGMWR